MISRRNFLNGMTATLAAARTAQHPLLTWALQGGNPPPVPGTEGMILRSYRFVDLEMPMEFLNSWITPVPHFFVRNHMHMPAEDAAKSWQLTVSGEVEKPVTLDFAALTKIESHSVTNALECAGNGRGFQRPIVPGVQWARGAVGNARFTGPRLHDVLERAGVKPTGKHVMFRGIDDVPGKVPPFIRSIPIEKAMDADTLIATQMNGAPLTHAHGAPARILAPGWLGAASCKWVTEIKVIDKEFDGNFMKPGYRFPDHAVEPGGSVNPEETHAITGLSVKSVIAAPSDDSRVSPGTVHVHGAAWAGEADIVKVEISTDSGATWQQAQLGADHARYAWRLWSYPWKAKPGEYVIMARATDRQGRTQPGTAAWNPSGYLYNAIDKVKVHVQA